MKNLGIFLFLVMILMIPSCGSSVGKEALVKEYFYDFLDAIGISTRVIENTEVVKIRFSDKSNQEKLRLLNALQWYVLSPNANQHADEHRIILVGKLHNQILNAPILKNEWDSQVDEYREFELIDWYMKRPFKKLTYDGRAPRDDDFLFGPDPEVIADMESEILTIEDFEYFDGIESYDLGKYVRE